MMESPRIYYDLMSQPSRAVILFLKVNNIEYIDNAVSLKNGENLTDEYTEINPFHSVPAMDDNGFLLTESEAILKYLCGRYDVADHWYPSDLHARAKVEEFCSWQQVNLRQNTTAIYTYQVLEPREKNIPVDRERLRKAQAQLDESLDTLELTFLADHDYLGGGSEVSLADLLAICEVMQTHAAGYDVGQDRPRLLAWMDRVQTRLQPHFDILHRPVQRALSSAVKM